MTEYLPTRPKDRHGFKIGIICALSLEAEMVEMIFDKRWVGVRYGKAPNDSNSYTTGVIAGHNVVLVYCSSMGHVSAAQAASGLMSSFINVKIVFVVGICGAVPSYIYRDKLQEIVLGDCCISTAVVQFSLGRKGPNGLVKKDGLDGLGRLNTQIRSLMAKLQTSINKQELTNSLTKHLHALQQADPDQVKWPGAAEDRLYKPSYAHTHHTLGETCRKCNVNLGICEKNCKDLGCEDRELEHREKVNQDMKPGVHFGYFGSSDMVLKSGQDRDNFAKADRIIAFEMEGAGIWDICPTIVIKAACDYADSHKNKKWQPYAAAVAAAGLKAFLQEFEFNDEAEYSRGFDPMVTQESPVSQQFTIPFLENRRFVGREDKLAELEQRLLSIDRETRQIAVFGLGGVGKTQLALAFCHAVKQRYPEYSIFWVSALSTARFKDDYTKIAKACSLLTDTKEDDVISIVQEYLSSGKLGKWLLIVDNADDKETLFDVNGNGIADKLPHSEDGITLFTSRYRDLAFDLADGSILNLETMSLGEATEFLTKSLKYWEYLVQDAEATKELLTELAFLPLAITQAASYMIKASISSSKYLALMRGTENEMIKLLTRDFRDNTRDRESRNAVAVTWLVSFDTIRKEEPMAAEILFFLAFLENKAIPLSLLPSLESEGDLTHAIGILLGYSFLTSHGEQQTYDMHRLVHRALKLWMQEEGILDEWRTRTVAHLAEMFPAADWDSRSVWREYIPHAIRVVSDPDMTPTKERADLCLLLGTCLRRDGRFREAIMYISECVSWDTNNPQEDKERLLISQQELASAYEWNAQPDEAIKLMEKVVAEKKLRPPVTDDDLDSQIVLARLYSRNNKLESAIHMLESVLQAKEAGASEDWTSLQCQQHLGEAYHRNGQTKDAVKILEKVVAIRSKKHAEDHPFRLSSEHRLARAYLEDGQTKAAVKMLQNVVEIEARVLDEYHTDRLTSQHELARAYIHDGQVKAAIEMLEKVVALGAKVRAETHPYQLRSQEVLSIAYERDGQLDRAVPLMQHVVRVQEKILPADHPDRVNTEYHLSRMLQLRAKEQKE